MDTTTERSLASTDNRPSRGLVLPVVALGILLFLLGWLWATDRAGELVTATSLEHDLAVGAFALVFSYLCYRAYRWKRSSNQLVDALTTRNRELETAIRDRRQAMELAHVDRINTLGKMASSIAHELNQPLFAIGTLTAACEQNLASGKEKREELREDLSIVSEQAARAGEIIRRLRHFGRMREIEKTPTNINDVVRETVRFLEPDARMNGVGLRTELASHTPDTNGDSILLQQVLLNLAKNAIDSLSGQEDREPELSIRTSVVDGERVRVVVCDNGKGVETPSEDLFQPFYSTKSDGLGMGLSISRSIVESHDGEIWATKNPERGMTFSFDLPALAATESA